jgi:hypothetical protein
MPTLCMETLGVEFRGVETTSSSRKLLDPEMRVQSTTNGTPVRLFRICAHEISTFRKRRWLTNVAELIPTQFSRVIQNY